MSEKDALLQVKNDGVEELLVDKIRRPHKSPKIRMKKKRCCLIATALVVVGAVILTIFLLLPDDGYNAEYLAYMRNEGNWSGVKTILIWNKFNESRQLTNWYSRLRLNKREKCNSHVCIFTTNENQPWYHGSVRDYNAIVFNAAKYYESSSSNNLYAAMNVYASSEPLVNVKYDFHANFYNLTMTYKLDSDVSFHNYGIRSLYDIKGFIAPAMNPDWHAPKKNWTNAMLRNGLQYRTNLTMVRYDSITNRMSESQRLVDKLKSYIDVDTRGDFESYQPQCTYRSCDQMPYDKYKFYLIAEKELCTDYVSDDFYLALQRSIVPVVFGGANYTRFAPPHSYIDANDFESVRELAEYLQHLDANPDEYIQYFWWTSLYRVSERNPFCDLCELLYDPPAERSVVERQQLLASNKECRLHSKLMG